MILPVGIGHSFPTQDRGIMADPEKIEIGNAHSYIFHYEIR